MAGYWFVAGFVTGFAVGVTACLVLVRHGMALHERIQTAIKDGVPVFGEYSAPLEQSNTSGETDLETDDLE